ncbi:hypothetical protein TRIATDRAFT_257846 [Trichoderma atroviride IMI 206040]|uniref:Uncharacterized protein n=1 Tax=Hypocrea atroviridis (strain ATCC 20476 / IMI 206040) TaxID=452589 RepID=G9NXQ0_HYPAI|nr:uncharacterized protein TRIATDRAFT_257846 [Trichoderma atroviride IMI 206040]EHK44230.1 hypothetical protein TRIATDRAFT_257846 [Trichoderma atroviride IMI 206040]
MAGAGLIAIISLTSSLVYAQTGLELSTGKHCKRVSHARILSNGRAREGELEDDSMIIRRMTYGRRVVGCVCFTYGSTCRRG